MAFLRNMIDTHINPMLEHINKTTTTVQPENTAPPLEEDAGDGFSGKGFSVDPNDDLPF